MALKRFKPTTPSQRFKTVFKSDDIAGDISPHKPLLVGLRKKAGRNNQGKITMRRRGGGHKRRYRIIDFVRNKYDITAKVESIEYDPNRNANIALLCYVDGERRYIIAPHGLEIGQTLVSSTKVDINVGNASPVGNIPIGTNVHNIELRRGKGGQMARSAGTFATITSHDKGYTLLKLPSGESRRIKSECYAVIGVVGNAQYNLITIGKAGRSAWMGKRPKVRGVAMNPIDHPHGGGEGKTSGGRHPVTPWGKITKGKKTRKLHKRSNSLIISSRKK